MTTAPTPQELAALGWDTIERILIGSACLLQSINQAQGEDSPNFSAVQVRTEVSASEQTASQSLTYPLDQNATTMLAELEALEALGWVGENLAVIKEILGDPAAALPATLPSIDLTKQKSIPLNSARFIGAFTLPLNNESLIESGILLENILEFDTLNTGEYDGVGPATPSIVLTPALPTIPPEVNSLERLLCWACLTLNASSSRAGEFVQVSPFYASNSLSISVSLPLDWEALSATGWHLVASVPRLVSEYVDIDPSSSSQRFGGTLPDFQYWLDPVETITELRSLSAPVGTMVYCRESQSLYGLADSLPDGESIDGFYFVEPLTPSGTEVWVKSLGLAGEPGADGLPGADSTVPGPTGPTGPAGADGADGADGKSAYQIAVDNGFVGTEAEWLTSLQGADGADGLPGIDGTGMAWRGPWDNATNYAQYDGIEYNGSTYIANAASLNKIPGTDPEWDLMVAKGPAGADGADGAGIVGNILTLPHAATPSDPGAGNTAIYAKSDGKVYKFPTGGIEEEIGAGGASAYSNLTDVDTTGLNVGQTMVWNGTFWVPGSASGGREVLTANRTYYVRTDGSDSNDGLSDTAGGAFLTIQKAIDVISGLDLSIYNATISVSNNITESVIAKKLTGAGRLIIKSTTGIIDWTGESGVHLLTIPAGVTNYETQSIKLTSPDTVLVSVYPGGSYYIGLDSDFGSTTNYHLYAAGGYIKGEANYTISGGGNCHFAARANGLIDFTNVTTVTTITNTPAFSSAFVRAFDSGVILMGGSSNTFSGSATGSRYSLLRNSTCYVDYRGTGYFPGSSGGTVDASSIYT